MNFSHHKYGPFVAVKIPRSSHNHTKWIGVALCASFAAHKQPNVIHETSFCLTCHLKTDIHNPCVHPAPDHVYCPNEEDLTLLNRLGGFIWLSYIPRRSLPDWSSQCDDRIEASFQNDCPGLTVEKCGLRFVYEDDGDEEEFEQMIRHCMKLLSDSNLETTEGRKLNGHYGHGQDSNYPKRLRRPVDRPTLKPEDKGKRVLE